MMKYSFLIFVALIIAACGGEETKTGTPSQQEMKTAINQMNDSLQLMFDDVMNGKLDKVPSLAIYETVNRYLAYYHAFPKDAYAAECLDRVHQLYLQEKVYDLSVQYGDTLLQKYPDYKGRANIYLSLGSTYDVMLRDTAKVRLYYSKLLNEFPKLPSETKDMVAFRLKHLDKTFDQMIEMQMNAITKK